MENGKPAKRKGSPMEPRQAGPLGQVEKRVIPSPAPYYGVGICWLVYAMLFPLYRMADFFILAVLSIVVYGVLRASFPGKTVIVERPPEPVDTGDPQADKLIAEGRESIRRIKEANGTIRNPALSEKISRLEIVTGKIFGYVAENPQKAPQLRKFLNYYLPTTIKLLDSYSRLSTQGVDGDNITSTMRSIEEIMDTIVEAFENQLDHLFQDEALDISTDITVLEGMLAREGLAKDDFKSMDQDG